MNAAEVFQQVGKRYTDCSSYEDEGTASTYSSERHLRVLNFKTYFARPDKFRFEWIDDHPDDPSFHIIWSDGKRVFTLYSFDGLKKEVESLRRAIAGAYGISTKASGLISSLLLPEVGSMLSKTVLALDDIRRLDDYEIDGEEFYCILGSWSAKTDTEVWISKEDFRLRRVKARHSNEPDSTLWSSEIDYVKSRFDGAIPDQMFTYNQPIET